MKPVKTNIDHIFACGDIVGPPMLAHKATHEGKVAAENLVSIVMNNRKLTKKSITKLLSIEDYKKSKLGSKLVKLQRKIELEEISEVKKIEPGSLALLLPFLY